MTSVFVQLAQSFKFNHDRTECEYWKLRHIITTIIKSQLQTLTGQHIYAATTQCTAQTWWSWKSCSMTGRLSGNISCAWAPRLASAAVNQPISWSNRAAFARSSLNAASILRPRWSDHVVISSQRACTQHTSNQSTADLTVTSQLRQLRSCSNKHVRQWERPVPQSQEIEINQDIMNRELPNSWEMR